MEDNSQQPKSPWWMDGVIIFAKVSASIAIPIILALITGEYLDKRYGTSPWFFLGLTFLAFPVSLFSIWKGLTDYLHKIEKEEKDKKNK